MSDASLRLAFDRKDGAALPIIDLPADRGTIHLHLHIGGGEAIASASAPAQGVAPQSVASKPTFSAWRGFWMAFGAMVALLCVYAVGLHAGATRTRAAADGGGASVASETGAAPADPLKIVRQEMARPPVITPPPGALPADAPNPFGLQQ